MRIIVSALRTPAKACPLRALGCRAEVFCTNGFVPERRHCCRRGVAEDFKSLSDRADEDLHRSIIRARPSRNGVTAAWMGAWEPYNRALVWALTCGQPWSWVTPVDRC